MCLPFFVSGAVLCGAIRNLVATSETGTPGPHRPDQVLVRSLKGFDNRYYLFQFTSPRQLSW